jgi:hypothetical protein
MLNGGFEIAGYFRTFCSSYFNKLKCLIIYTALWLLVGKGVLSRTDSEVDYGKTF